MPSSRSTCHRLQPRRCSEAGRPAPSSSPLEAPRLRRRPPPPPPPPRQVVEKTVEKIVEKPVYIEKRVEVERPVYIQRTVEKPVYVPVCVPQAVIPVEERIVQVDYREPGYEFPYHDPLTTGCDFIGIPLPATSDPAARWNIK
mmetsp:Transcript_79938/g.185644  ORF Transcript_79938/g.185644 Transcript_79938/m.185644 type:complete len:143 (-) Transcript_79938:122-550(-)